VHADHLRLLIILF